MKPNSRLQGTPQGQQAHPGWIQRLAPQSPSTPQRLGASQAFNRLLLATTAPYVALCDQDDIWFPDRLATGLAQLQAAEAAHPRGPQQPLLLHSDALLIDADGLLACSTKLVALCRDHRAATRPAALAPALDC